MQSIKTIDQADLPQYYLIVGFTSRFRGLSFYKPVQWAFKLMHIYAHIGYTPTLCLKISCFQFYCKYFHCIFINLHPSFHLKYHMIFSYDTSWFKHLQHDYFQKLLRSLSVLALNSTTHFIRSNANKILPCCQPHKNVHDVFILKVVGNSE
jgi:hypothetical protein